MVINRSLRVDGRQRQRRQLDELFARKVKERDGWTCRLCHSRQSPQCAHLLSRMYAATRWDLDNAWTLCQRCHYRWTKRPAEWTMLLENKLGRDEYERLRARAFGFGSKPDYAAVRLYLERGTP